MLDFGASWCKPCRIENTTLISLYNKYHSHGFEIIQVSLENSIDELRKAIKEDKLPWEAQICDLKRWQSPIVLQYMVKAIPQYFLIDKNGKIAAICKNTDELNKTLKNIFKGI